MGLRGDGVGKGEETSYKMQLGRVMREWRGEGVRVKFNEEKQTWVHRADLHDDDWKKRDDAGARVVRGNQETKLTRIKLHRSLIKAELDANWEEHARSREEETRRRAIATEERV